MVHELLKKLLNNSIECKIKNTVNKWGIDVLHISEL